MHFKNISVTFVKVEKKKHAKVIHCKAMNKYSSEFYFRVVVPPPLTTHSRTNIHIRAHRPAIHSLEPHNNCVHPGLDSGGAHQRAPFTSPWGLNGTSTLSGRLCAVLPIPPADALAHEELPI